MSTLRAPFARLSSWPARPPIPWTIRWTIRWPGRWHPGHALLAGLILLVVLLLARLLAVLASPTAAPAIMSPPPPADTSLLARLDPFGGGAAPQDVAVTALELSLHGVRADRASGRGAAIIAGPDGEQASYGVGDSVGGATLVAIAADHVVLDNGGRREALYLDAGGATMADATGAPDAPFSATAMAPAARQAAVPMSATPPDMPRDLPAAAPDLEGSR